MASLTEKTFVVQLKKTAENLSVDGKLEIKASAISVQGDFLLLLDENGKGIAAFPASSIIQVQEKTGLGR